MADNKKNFFKSPIFVVSVSLFLVILLVIIFVFISAATNPKGKYENALKQKLKQDKCSLTKNSKEYLNLLAKKLQINKASKMFIDSKVESSMCSQSIPANNGNVISSGSGKTNLTGAKGHINLGDMLVTQKKYNKAENEFKAAIRDDENYYLGYFDLSSVYIQKHFYDKAINILKIGIKKSGENDYLYYDLSVAYSKKGDLGVALDNLKKSISLGFNDVNSLENDPGLENLRLHEKDSYCRILHKNKLFIKFCQ